MGSTSSRRTYEEVYGSKKPSGRNWILHLGNRKKKKATKTFPPRWKRPQVYLKRN